MVANPDKFQTIFLGVGSQEINIKVNNLEITSSYEVELLGLIIDNQLNFLPHILNMCSKSLSKTKALMRIRGYLCQKQADVLFFRTLCPGPSIWK